MKTSITILYFLLQVSCILLAYSPTSLNENPLTADSSSIEKDLAKNVIYVDVATAIFVGYENISYERMITDFLSLRIGYGFGYKWAMGSPTSYSQGFNLMANIFTSKQSSKFEIGLGLSYCGWKEDLKKDPGIAFSLGYRYQPKFGGFIFRIGGTLIYWWHKYDYGNVGDGVGGLHVSLGYAF